MSVTVKLKVKNCKDCPFYRYGGTSWGEDYYECSKSGREVDEYGIDAFCPFKLK